MKILIVDDNEDNLEMMDIVLKSNNYSIKSALNGKTALEMLRKEHFDLIISDILMPVMDGFQLCKECKQDKDLCNIPFIFYTATYVDSQDEELAISLGAQQFIRKPQEPDVFLNIINDVIYKAFELEYTVKGIIEQDETVILKLYSERLISKLEKKNLDLESEIASHKKTMSDLIAAKIKAEESDRLKSAFLANMSHEIRTPLNGILGFSQLLVSEINSKDEIKEYSEIIFKSSRRLFETVNNILEISKIETGQIAVSKNPVSINIILSDLHMLFSPVASAKNINLSYHKALDDDSCVIESDESKLYNIMNNLIDNAIKFTIRGNIEFGYEIVDDEILFYVKDSGIGVSPDMQSKIFERFTQADLSISRGYEGSGLGLAICKGLAEIMGGKIWVESDLNKGSIFFFSIPYAPIMQIDNPTHENGISFSKRISSKILIAEDDFISYLYLKKLLNDVNCIILWVKNGEQAVKFVKNTPDIDFVLMDIKMPVLDGIEATRQIKIINPELPIIAHTAFAFNEEKKRIMAVGCDDYLSKPILKEQFLSLIKKYVKH